MSKHTHWSGWEFLPFDDLSSIFFLSQDPSSVLTQASPGDLQSLPMKGILCWRWLPSLRGDRPYGETYGETTLQLERKGWCSLCLKRKSMRIKTGSLSSFACLPSSGFQVSFPSLIGLLLLLLLSLCCCLLELSSWESWDVLSHEDPSRDSRFCREKDCSKETLQRKLFEGEFNGKRGAKILDITRQTNSSSLHPNRIAAKTEET